MRPMRIEIGGIDVTRFVTDVQLDTEPTDMTSMTDPTMTRRMEHAQRTLTLDVAPELENAIRQAVITERLRTNGFFASVTSVPEWQRRHFLGVRPSVELPDEATEFAVETHEFAQDPDERAQLCGECGMWPGHHNHGRGRCVCADCMPDADWLPPDETPGLFDRYTERGDDS